MHHGLLATTALGRLLIAMPQSMSTTLMVGLRDASALSAKQLTMCRYRNFTRDSAFNSLATHSDTCNLSRELMTHLVASAQIFKQHVVPSATNLAHLSHLINRSNGSKIVLLTRDALESARGFCRREKGGGKYLNRYPAKRFEDRYQSLHQWDAGWHRFARDNCSSHVHRVTTNRLKANFTHEVLTILQFWGLKQTHSFNVTRQRYINATSYSDCDNLRCDAC